MFSHVSNICAVKHCLSQLPPTPASSDDNIHLFRFPLDEQRCRRWAAACGILPLFDRYVKMGLSLNASYFRVCSLHFDDSMYAGVTKRRLHHNTIPTLLLPQTSGHVTVEELVHEEITHKSVEDNVQSNVSLPQTEKKISTEMLYDNPVPSTSKEFEVAVCGADESIPLFISDEEDSTTMSCIHDEHLPTTSVQCQTPGIISEDTPVCKSAPTSYSPTGCQTPQKLSSRTPRKEILRHRIKTLRKENMELKKQLRKAQKQGNKEDVSDEHFNLLIRQKFPQSIATFILHQKSLHNKKRGGRRFSTEFKYLCLKIYFLSPKCYNFLSTCFDFPTRRTLSRLTENIKIPPGIQPSILKIKVDALLDIDKNCVLCLDEMSIKANLFYNLTTDEAIGLEDIGSGKVFNPALNTLTLMVKGLYNNWKQPFAYFYSYTTVSAADLKNIIFEAVNKLRDIGLYVRVIVGDMGSSNIAVANILNITPEKPFFQIGDNIIFFIFDVPHLIKATRNNLYKYDFCQVSSRASWKYIEAMYNIDKTLQSRLAPKLCDSHVNPINRLKMKVSLATQVLSASVANALGVLISLGHLSTEGGETQRVIELFDNVFDILNSGQLTSKKRYNRAFCGDEFQNNLLLEMLAYLDNMKVVDKQGKDFTKKVKFINCWKITINSVLQLWPKLSEDGFKFLLTWRVNQDALENFFGTIRKQSGCCINPTAIQFMRAFRKLFCLRFLNAGAENCGDDYGKIFANITDFHHENIYEEPPGAPNINVTNITSLPVPNDYRYLNIEQNSVRYICGYLIKKCLNVHSCEVCTNFANEHQQFDETTILSHFKAYKTDSSLFGNLFMPHNDFFVYVMHLEEL